MKTSRLIADFWRLFTEKSSALERTGSADEPVYDELLEQLQRIDPGLFLEFSSVPGDCELIITAEGDRSLFGLVDFIVSAAPRISGWRVLALRPKLGFPESVEWEGLQVIIADVVFEPLSEQESDDVGLRLLVPGISEADMENAHNALLRALDHGLGERELARAVQYTKVAPLLEPADEYIPLADLETFIQWRSKRRKG
jgi:hypothetical protein